MPVDLNHRHLHPELMDDPSLDRGEHARALRGLARIHRLTFTPQRIWREIRQRISPPGQALRILDVGCSDGWLSRQIVRRARRHGWEVELMGCDFSMQALQMFREAAERDGLTPRLVHVDILQQEIPCQADVVLNSLFLHHFQGDQVVTILQKLASATRQLLLVEDLLRTRLGWYYCQLGVRLLSRSRVVRIDGPLSVRAAFSLKEMEAMLGRAGLAPKSELVKHWPERFLIRWTPTV
jgi:2-polyprenyl-3-methyl-5-hydroxy-6-metoxy-1,4-benzoquinol methylase